MLAKGKLNALTTEHVRAFVAGVRATPGRGGCLLSSRTVHFSYAVLRLILNRAVKDELVGRNVAALVDAPRVEVAEQSPWSVVDARAFLAAVADHRLYALFAVGVGLGLRRGELVALRWPDVDLEEKTLTITRPLQRVQGTGLIEGPVKTNRSRRTVALPEVCVTALRRHRGNQAADRLAAGSAWVNDDRVFATTHGTPIEPRNLNRTFELPVKHAGVRRIPFHDLRHTCATLLLAQKVPARVVMETLGHSQIAVTMNTYGHVLPETQREAARQMDDVFGFSG